MFKFDNKVAFWNALAVGNYAARFYKHAMAEVTSRFLALEQQTFAAVKEVETKLMSNPSVWYNPTALESDLTKFTHEQATKITSAWRDMLPEIITKYVVSILF